jgi:signal transduction histidine kinase
MNVFHTFWNTLKRQQERFFDRFRNRVYPATFVEEVNEQCRIFFPLYAPPFFVSWWGYIALDAQLVPSEPLMPILRTGLAVAGVVALILRQSLQHEGRHRLIAIGMMYYMIIATGIITGLAKAHPSYVGGYCFLITVLSAMPLQLSHLYTGLALSLTAFGVLCLRAEISLASAAMQYSFNDLVNTVVVNGILSYGWMMLRRNSYEKGRALQELNERMKEQQALVTLQNQQLAELNAEKDEILGIVSHDLKNPLTAILGFTEVMSSSQYELQQEEFQRFSQRIQESASRMQSLIQRLLDANALEDGKLKARLVPMDVLHVVQDMVRAYQEQANEKHIRLEYLMPSQAADSIKAIADETFLNQIVENLLSNALKYSPTGKKVQVWVDGGQWANGDANKSASQNNAPPTSDNKPLHEPSAVAAIHYPLSTPFVCISVRDEGPGLSDADKAKLFNKFTRLSAQPTGGESSTGLGLSIVKKLVDAMNGRVWCESSLGQGATFVVELPAATTHE